MGRRCAGRTIRLCWWSGLLVGWRKWWLWSRWVGGPLNCWWLTLLLVMARTDSVSINAVGRTKGATTWEPYRWSPVIASWRCRPTSCMCTTSKTMGPPTKVSSCYSTLVPIHAQRKNNLSFPFFLHVSALFSFDKCHTRTYPFRVGLLPTYSIDKMALFSPIIYSPPRKQIINTREKELPITTSWRPWSKNKIWNYKYEYYLVDEEKVTRSAFVYIIVLILLF